MAYRPGDKPVVNEIRVIERDGKRWLQQWRLKPDGQIWEHEWIDVAELAPLPSNVRPLKR